jgi:thiamine monophosphate synthase
VWRGALGLRTASAHDPAEARAALAAGAVALIWGPVFDARSKPVGGRGLGALATFAASAPVPVIPIGGVDPDHIAALFSAGAWGVAALTPFCAPPDAAAAARRWIAAIEAATRGMPTSVSAPCDDRDR